MTDSKKEIDELSEIFSSTEMFESLLPETKTIQKNTQIEIVDSQPSVYPVQQVRTDDELVEDDFKYARESLKEIIDTGRVSLEMLKEIANGSCRPEAFEALGGLIRTISESTMELINLHGKMKDIRSDGPKKVTNNLVITTDELIKMIKGK